MKRMLLCVVIFAAVIASASASVIMLGRSTRELIARVDRCIESYESGSAQLDDDIGELCRYWEKYYKRTSLITRSSSLEEMAVSASKLERLAAEGGEFTAELMGIRHRAYMIYDSQLPHLWSLF